MIYLVYIDTGSTLLFIIIWWCCSLDKRSRNRSNICLVYPFRFYLSNKRLPSFVTWIRL